MPRPIRKSREAVILGQRLAALRRLAKLTQEEVAIAVGMSRSTLAGHETGHSMPSRQVMSDLARLFNVSMDYLDRGVDIERPDPGEPPAEKVGVAKVLHYWAALDDKEKSFVLQMVEQLAKKG